MILYVYVLIGRCTYLVVSCVDIIAITYEFLADHTVKYKYIT